MVAKRSIRLISLFSFIIISTCNTLFADNIEPAIAWTKLNANEMIIIDVRTVNEWKETGVIPGSLLVNKHDSNFSEKKNFLKEIENTISNNSDKKIAIICASGGRSSITMKALISKGYENIYNVSGGIAGKPSENYPGWLNLKLPLEECNNKCVD